MARGDVQLTGLRRLVAQVRQRFLEPGDARQVRGVLRLEACHRLRVGPDAQAFLGQALPWEQRPRVQLAQRRDIAVTDDVSGVDAVARADVLEQHLQGFHLRFGIRVPHAARRRVAEPWVDDLDPDGAGVQPGAAHPLAFPGMPGALAFIHQLVDGARSVVADQVMAADLTMGQQRQGAFEVGRGVMDDHELHAVVMVDRRVAGIQARAAGAAAEQEEHKGEVHGFHGG